MPGQGEVAQRATRSARGSGTSRRRSAWRAQAAAIRQRTGSSAVASRMDAPPRGETTPPRTPAWSASGTAAAPSDRGSVARAAPASASWRSSAQP